MSRKPIIISTCEQGSPRWKEIRRGIPTGTGFASIVTAAQAKPAAGRKKYSYKLIEDSIDPRDEIGNKMMLRGQALEANARASFEFDYDLQVNEFAFIFGDRSRSWGCSPDGLIGACEGVELKCPGLDVLVGYNEEMQVPGQYLGQLYANLYVSQRKRWHFYAYSVWDAEPSFHAMVEADSDGYQRWAAAMDVALPKFLADLNSMRMRRGLCELGSDKSDKLLERFDSTSTNLTSETAQVFEGEVVAYF